ncbi:acetolactate synthase large subunit [Vibrio mangrovi]|uniref:Acetolactate synthase large subunit n=1 Tax=Vibrio mangrovi TaxID=474394 RepID=A0A1Y6IWC1_9VIBR|nr:acetolactate synthase large subunit [Vibrio mangrovi]MDW6002521.1 acetolactate synthase large subunit [Vibrio mangrovi]SMS01947.1 Putative acetolactate synthase large subunit IlvX [Vibrio mangrovi]
MNDVVKSCPMNGAESLLRTLVENGVEVCFANPGTSEMHFVAALDRVSGMRPVLALQENVATGAADGYGRMTGKPACTLLHLGPGLANGLANLHNARRADSPIVNIVGDHATTHLQYDAPLTSDIHGFARPVSEWVYTSSSSQQVGADAARAVRVASESPGQIATLILPADIAWNEAESVASCLAPSTPATVSAETVHRVAELLNSGLKTAILMRGAALLEPGLTAAGRIAEKTGARLLCDTFAPRIQRGAGRVAVERLPYFSEQVVDFLAGTELIVLVGAKPPVSFFAYPDKPSWLTPEGCRLTRLTEAHEDSLQALEDLAHACGATQTEPFRTRHKAPEYALDGDVNAEFVMQVIARYLPENAIITDESASSGFPYYDITETAAAHDYLNLTGGALGSMMAVSIGAAIACPERKVINLQGDGSAMYLLPSLWTQARENLDVVTVVYSNRSYNILDNELKRVGAMHQGQSAASLMSLENPSINWLSLASGMGVRAVRTETRKSFDMVFREAMQCSGPQLIEVVL